MQKIMTCMFYILVFIFAIVLCMSAVRADYNEITGVNYRVSPYKKAQVESVLSGETTWKIIRLKELYNAAPERICYHENCAPMFTICSEGSAAAQEAKENKEFLAKLLYAEAGSMSWEGQVFVCSAILNLCDSREITIDEAGHTEGMFSVAPYVDSVTPMLMQYDVIDYVLSGGRISYIKYFQCGWYHNFGTPVCYIENVYFSM